MTGFNLALCADLVRSPDVIDLNVLASSFSCPNTFFFTTRWHLRKLLEGKQTPQESSLWLAWTPVPTLYTPKIFSEKQRGDVPFQKP